MKTLTQFDLSAHAEVPRMREDPRFVDTLDLVALPTAVPVARMFISGTLNRWHALFIEEHMAPVAVELVMLSVEATRPAEETSWTDIAELNSITLRMLGYQRHIVFEVTDTHDEPLVLPADANVSEDGGLGLVDAQADRWGSFLSPQGRVNWAELAVYGRTEAGLPLRDPKPPVYPAKPTDMLAPTVDSALLRRVRDRLRHLH